jgi:hypothetical protein
MIESTGGQACTRDVSQIISGLTGPISDLDFPDYRSYHFNNEWVDPSGVQAVMVGDAGAGQGVVAVEVWSPPTACAPTHSVYLAPPNSGSLTVTGVVGSTVGLASSAGTTWTFDLTDDSFAEGN